MITTTQSRGAGTIGGRPLTEFLLVPFGHVEVDQAISGKSFDWTRSHAVSAVRWFRSLGRKLAIDYEHQTLSGVRGHPEGLAPAAGWIGKLEVRGDGLWAADVEWTEKARQHITAGEYRYFSPVIYWTDAEHTDVKSLGPVGLTNDPAIPSVQPLAARAQRRRRDVTAATTAFATVCSGVALPLVYGEADDLKLQELLDLLGLSAEAPLEEVLAKVTEASLAYVVEALGLPPEATLDEVKAAISTLMTPEAETTASRAAIIVAARRSFAAECANPRKVVICSERAWVHTVLRDAKLARLTAGEVARLGIAESSNPAPVSAAARGRPVTPTQSADRASLIAAAKRGFAEECADPSKRVICSELAWVNTALRDAGQRRLTEDEIATRGVAE